MIISKVTNYILLLITNFLYCIFIKIERINDCLWLNKWTNCKTQLINHLILVWNVHYLNNIIVKKFLCKFRNLKRKEFFFHNWVSCFKITVICPFKFSKFFIIELSYVSDKAFKKVNERIAIFICLYLFFKYNSFLEFLGNLF